MYLQRTNVDIKFNINSFFIRKLKERNNRKPDNYRPSVKRFNIIIDEAKPIERWQIHIENDFIENRFQMIFHEDRSTLS